MQRFIVENLLKIALFLVTAHFCILFLDMFLEIGMADEYIGTLIVGSMTIVLFVLRRVLKNVFEKLEQVTGKKWYQL